MLEILACPNHFRSSRLKHRQGYCSEQSSFTQAFVVNGGVPETYRFGHPFASYHLPATVQKALRRTGAPYAHASGRETETVQGCVVCSGGPTRTRTWDQRIMSPLL